MVEGGGQVIASFLAQRLVDLVVLTIAPVFMGGVKGVDALLPVAQSLDFQLSDFPGIQEGVFKLPQGPGLGLELDGEVMEKYRVKTES